MSIDLDIFSANLSADKIRRVTHLGRQYLVAPISIIKPGVLNGSRGPVYYPEQEVGASPDIWNGMPLTLNHPMDDNGDFKSARTPEVLESHSLGFVSNTKFDGKLRTEGWFDEDLVLNRSPELHARLLKGKPIEVSTGLLSDLHPAEDGAEFEGVQYKMISRNFRADHIAVLLDDKGACSVDDGCGINNALGNESVTNQLLALLRDRYDSGLFSSESPASSPWIVDVFESKVVFHHKDRLYELPFKVSAADKVSLGNGPAKEVVRQISYVSVNNTKGSPEMAKLTPERREIILNTLVANCQCKDTEKALLNKLDDDTLEILERNKAAETEPPQEPTPVTNASGNDQKSIDELVKASLGKMSPAQFFDYAPAEIKEVIANAKATQDRAKLAIIDSLTAGLEGTPKDVAVATLNKLSVQDLENLQPMKPQKSSGPANPFLNGGHADASLGSGPAPTTNGSQQAVMNALALPSIDWSAED